MHCRLDVLLYFKMRDVVVFFGRCRFKSACWRFLRKLLRFQTSARPEIVARIDWLEQSAIWTGSFPRGGGVYDVISSKAARCNQTMSHFHLLFWCAISLWMKSASQSPPGKAPPRIMVQYAVCLCGTWVQLVRVRGGSSERTFDPARQATVCCLAWVVEEVLVLFIFKDIAGIC